MASSTIGGSRGPARLPGALLVAILAGLALPAVAAFTPPQNLNPQSTPALDASFNKEVWLVYTYEIDTDGRVINATIERSNGVPEAERHMLQQIEAMRFQPAMRDGQATKVPAGPVVYTWLLDLPREMRPEFSDLYEQAWEHFRAADYERARALATRLGELPGRNAYEEVKLRILSASLANRSQDPAAEMRHLQRVAKFQQLADRNDFRHPYVPPEHFALMLERIHALELDNNQLADAQATFNLILMRGSPEDVVQRVQSAQQTAQARLESQPVVTIRGELQSLYPGGPGDWETRLSRDRFRLAEVEGAIDWLYLVCGQQERRLPYPATAPWAVPSGWRDCGVEIGGREGTHFALQQLQDSGGR